MGTSGIASAGTPHGVHSWSHPLYWVWDTSYWNSPQDSSALGSLVFGSLGLVGELPLVPLVLHSCLQWAETPVQLRKHAGNWVG